jgi:uncharacterized RDD family membrane protein YckC
MNTFVRRLLVPAGVALLCAAAISAQTHAAQSADAQSASADVPEQHEWPAQHRWHHDWHGGDDHGLVSVGHDSHLLAGQRVQSVVAVLGSAISEGEAEDVVSVLGNTRVTGAVGDSVVSVFGNTYIDSTVGGDVAAVLGDIVLGPHADIGGDVVALGGTLQRDPSAIVHGDVQNVFSSRFGIDWLRPWVRHCLFYGRPLALVPGIGWAWGVALSFLALYVFLALLFPSSISRCVLTFETKPGHSIVAALLSVLLSPILLTLLCVTVIGIAAVPFVVVGLFCAGLFGKAVMLAWIGRRCVGRPAVGALSHPALAVLIGGAVVLALYLVPVLGFVLYKLLGLLGLGAVVYTLLQTVRVRRANKGTEQAVPGPASAPGAANETAAAVSAASPAAAPATRPTITAALPRAGFWVRMAALLLDALLVGILIDLLHHLFNLELLVLAIYGAAMWKLRGSTIGGIVFDLQVVRQDGREIDWATAIVRALACFLSLAAAGLGFIWIAFDDGKQAWHDKIAGTVVVRVTKGVSLV